MAGSSDSNPTFTSASPSATGAIGTSSMVQSEGVGSPCGRAASRMRRFARLTGEPIGARTAEHWGLVNRVVPAAQLDGAVAQLAEAISAKAEVAVRMGKNLFYRQLEMGTAAAYQLAGQTMACNMMDDAALDGVQAFLDKRRRAA